MTTIRSRVRQSSFASDAQEAMVGLLVAAAHLERRLGEVFEDHGLTHDQYNVLRILRGVHPQGHPRYEIGDRLIDRSPDVTRLLDRLERRGLVERYRSDEDRRLSLSRVTAEGLALLGELDPRVASVHTAFAAPLDPEGLGRLTNLCGRLIGTELGEP